MVTFTGKVLNLDGIPDILGEVFDQETAVELPSYDVPVNLDFYQEPEFRLGTAKLYFEPDALMYQMELDDSKLPKYALETLFPAVGGFVLKRSKNKMEHIKVTQIALTPSGNADIRIGNLNNQNQIYIRHK